MNMSAMITKKEIQMKKTVKIADIIGATLFILFVLAFLGAKLYHNYWR